MEVIQQVIYTYSIILPVIQVEVGSDPRKGYDQSTYLGKFSFVDASSMRGIGPFLPA